MKPEENYISNIAHNKLLKRPVPPNILGLYTKQIIEPTVILINDFGNAYANRENKVSEPQNHKKIDNFKDDYTTRLLLHNTFNAVLND